MRSAGVRTSSAKELRRGIDGFGHLVDRGVALGGDEVEEDAADDEDAEDGEQVPRGEDRLAHGHDLPAEGLGEERVRGRRGERTRARIPHVPDDHAGVAGGDEEREVDLDPAVAGLDGDLAGEQGADDEAEAPRDEAGDRGDEEDEDVGEGCAAGDAGEPGEQRLHGSRVREDVAEEEDEAHLGHEFEQTRQPHAPARDDLERARPGEDEGEDRDDEGEDDGEGQRRGDPPLEDAVDRAHHTLGDRGVLLL